MSDGETTTPVRPWRGLAGHFAILFAILASWETGSALGAIDPLFFPRPSDILQGFWRLYVTQGNIWPHLGLTMVEVLVGFAAGSALGIALALCVGSFDSIRRYMKPYVIVLEATPRIAIGPVIIAAFGFEEVRRLAVTEDMHKQNAIGTQPFGDSAQQQRVVPHMLEHLDRHNAIELGIRLELGDIRGDHVDVLQASRGSLLIDELLLSCRIRDGRDLAPRKFLGHPQRQRPPAAAELEYAHTVFQFGAVRRQPQHRRFGFRQRGLGRRPISAAVL